MLKILVRHMLWGGLQPPLTPWWLRSPAAATMLWSSCGPRVFLVFAWTTVDCSRRFKCRGTTFWLTPKAENPIWGKNCGCLRRQMLKILVLRMMWGGLQPPLTPWWLQPPAAATML